MVKYDPRLDDAYTAASMLVLECVRLIVLASSSAVNGATSAPYDTVELLRMGMVPECRLPGLACPGKKDGDNGTSICMVSPWWLL